LISDKRGVAHYCIEARDLAGLDGEEIAIDQLAILQLPTNRAERFLINVNSPYLRAVVSSLVKVM
jgi:hypothetical protein